MKVRVWRVCWLCGESFEGTYKSRYCSNAHRQAAYRNRRDEKILQTGPELNQLTIEKMRKGIYSED